MHQSRPNPKTGWPHRPDSMGKEGVNIIAKLGEKGTEWSFKGYWWEYLRGAEHTTVKNHSSLMFQSQRKSYSAACLHSLFLKHLLERCYSPNVSELFLLSVLNSLVLGWSLPKSQWGEWHVDTATQQFMGTNLCYLNRNSLSRIRQIQCHSVGHLINSQHFSLNHDGAHWNFKTSLNIKPWQQ